MAAAQTPTPAPLAIDPSQLVARLGAQRQKFKAAAQHLTTQRDGLQAEVDRLTKENSDLKGKADNSATAKRVLELEQQIREGNHRRAFDRLAKAKGVPEDSLDLLWQVSGYKAQADEIDEPALSAVIDEQKAKPGVSRLFGAAAPPVKEGQSTPPNKPAPGSGQGGGSPNGVPPMAHDDTRWSDVAYMMNNFQAVADAASQRIARGEV